MEPGKDGDWTSHAPKARQGAGFQRGIRDGAGAHAAGSRSNEDYSRCVRVRAASLRYSFIADAARIQSEILVMRDDGTDESRRITHGVNERPCHAAVVEAQLLGGCVAKRAAGGRGEKSKPAEKQRKTNRRRRRRWRQNAKNRSRRRQRQRRIARKNTTKSTAL